MSDRTPMQHRIQPFDFGDLVNSVGESSLTHTEHIYGATPSEIVISVDGSGSTTVRVVPRADNDYATHLFPRVARASDQRRTCGEAAYTRRRFSELQRRLIRGALMVTLLAFAMGVGWLIGNAGTTVEAPPIPIPMEMDR